MSQAHLANDMNNSLQNYQKIMQEKIHYLKLIRDFEKWSFRELIN